MTTYSNGRDKALDSYQIYDNCNFTPYNISLDKRVVQSIKDISASSNSSPNIDKTKPKIKHVNHRLNHVAFNYDKEGVDGLSGWVEYAANFDTYDNELTAVQNMELRDRFKDELRETVLEKYSKLADLKQFYNDRGIFTKKQNENRICARLRLELIKSVDVAAILLRQSEELKDEKLELTRKLQNAKASGHHDLVIQLRLQLKTLRKLDTSNEENKLLKQCSSKSNNFDIKYFEKQLDTITSRRGKRRQAHVAYNSAYNNNSSRTIISAASPRKPSLTTATSSSSYNSKKHVYDFGVSRRQQSSLIENLRKERRRNSTHSNLIPNVDLFVPGNNLFGGVKLQEELVIEAEEEPVNDNCNNDINAISTIEYQGGNQNISICRYGTTNDGVTSTNVVNNNTTTINVNDIVNTKIVSLPGLPMSNTPSNGDSQSFTSTTPEDVLKGSANTRYSTTTSTSRSNNSSGCMDVVPSDYTFQRNPKTMKRRRSRRLSNSHETLKSISRASLFNRRRSSLTSLKLI